MAATPTATAYMSVGYVSSSSLSDSHKVRKIFLVSSLMIARFSRHDATATPRSIRVGVNRAGLDFSCRWLPGLRSGLEPSDDRAASSPSSLSVTRRSLQMSARSVHGSIPTEARASFNV